MTDRTLHHWILCSILFLAALLPACSGPEAPAVPPRLGSAPTGDLSDIRPAAQPLLALLRSGAARNVAAVPRAAAGTHDAPGQRSVDGVTLDQVFNLAERLLPALFPDLPATLRTGPFTYRYHAGTQTYLAIDDENIVWLLGPEATGGKAVAVGPLAPFLDLVRQDALDIYRVAGSIYLDAHDFLSPSGTPGEFFWTSLSAPAGWPGLFYSDPHGLIGFNPANSAGVLSGTYRFQLTQKRPGVADISRVVQVHVCCDARTPLAEMSAFAPRLQRWSLPDLQNRFSGVAGGSLEAMLRFANTYGLGAVELDLLRGVALGSTYDEALLARRNAPSGGALVQGARYRLDGVARVSKDLDAVAYPGDYQASGPAELSENPYCSYRSEATLLRTADLGTLALPEVQARKLARPFGLVADMKDVWGRLSPQFQVGCSGDFRQVYLQALEELRRNGVTQITLRPWTVFDGSGSTWQVLHPLDGNDGAAISDADFEWMVKAAHERGLKVAWANQIQIAFKDVASGQVYSTAEATPERVTKSMEAVERFLLERGEFMQRIGVDSVWLPGAWYWADFKSVLGVADYRTWSRASLQALRSHYRGQVVTEPDPDLLQDSTIASAIDAYFYSPQAIFPESDLSRLSVDFLQERFTASHASIQALLAGKKLVYYLNAASYRRFFHSGYLEETGCTNGYGLDAGPFSYSCIQKTHQPDMALQAIYHEAALRFLAQHAELDASQVTFQYWWFAENPLPGTAFPNLATSVRGKPAELIVHRWWKAQQ